MEIDGVELYMSQGDIVLLNKYALQAIQLCNPETLIVNVCIKDKLFWADIAGVCDG